MFVVGNMRSCIDWNYFKIKIISKSTIRVQLQTHEHTDSTREGKSKGNVRLRVYIILYDDEYQNISFCVKSGGWPDSGWAFSLPQLPSSIWRKSSEINFIIMVKEGEEKKVVFMITFLTTKGKAKEKREELFSLILT